MNVVRHYHCGMELEGLAVFKQAAIEDDLALLAVEFAVEVGRKGYE